MTLELSDLKAKVHFYLREHLYHSMLTACIDGVKSFKTDLSLKLFRALALSLNHRLQECIKELHAIRGENDVKLAATVALIYSMKNVENSDARAVNLLEDDLREFKESATFVDFCNTAWVYYILEKYNKALIYVDKSLKAASENVDTLNLKGWILLHTYSDTAKNIVGIFELCLRDNKRSLDASLGLAEAYVYQKQYDEAISTINKCVVRFPALNIPLIHKAKILFSVQDFDQANEVISRILVTDEKNYVANKLNILLLICKSAKYETAAKYIAQFSEVLDVIEPNNGKVLADNSILFSRICNRDENILLETYKMLGKALILDNTNIDFLNELGYQCYLQGRINEALKYYKTASKTDNTSLNALLGMTLCELAEQGKSEHIKQQIFFLLEIQENGVHPMLLFMQAKMSDDQKSTIQFLEEAFSEHLKPVMHLPYNEEFLKLLNPDFLIDVLKTYMQYASNSGSITKINFEKSNNVIENTLSTLKIVTKAVPGLEDAQYMLGYTQYLQGDYLNAMKTLTYLVNELNASSAEAHLLIAQIHLNNKAYERASQSLETGLSSNFKIHEHPLYHLIKGMIHVHEKNISEAIKSLTVAITLLDIVNDIPPKKSKLNVTVVDKATIYLELINAHKQANQHHEATKLLEAALEEFSGTPEQMRIMIVNAEYAAAEGNVEQAIDMLTMKAKPFDKYYAQAKTALADIFLVYRQDKRAFLKCYIEILENKTTAESYCLLGDAYLKILEPDKALDAYNNALQMSPNDPYLVNKMGKALIDAHYYKKAVVFYNQMIKVNDTPELKLQLAQLHMNMKDFDKAESLLKTEIDAEIDKNTDDVVSLQYRTKLFMNLCDTYEKSGNVKNAMDALKAARDNQNRVRKLMMVEHNNVPEEEIQCLVEINIKLAEIATSVRENEKAINYYKDALLLDSNNVKVLTALAKLYIQMNYMELCQQVCNTLLKIEPDNEIASVLMADIAFRKIDFPLSLLHFQQLVSKQPTNWVALVRLLEIMKRTGNIEQFPQYLQAAEDKCNPSELPAGFLFTTGMYQWYSGNLNAALRTFNAVRQDPDWGQQAIYNMIEICLNPDDDLLGDQLIDNDDMDSRDAKSMALSTAQRLLKELKQKSNSLGEDSLKCRVLSNFLLLATKDKYSIEQALDDFVSLASNDNYKDQVGPILGVATAYMMMKQNQRAKTQLKRVVKNVWTFEDAEYLERCWLLLADYYLQANKLDMAADLVKKVLQHNKSSYKAYEYMGYIAEKEQKYKEASSYYESAWKFNAQNKPTLGYKLAYTLMKCKKYADAIDVGQQVLKAHPEFTKIKKDVLDKSINNLRT